MEIEIKVSITPQQYIRLDNICLLYTSHQRIGPADAEPLHRPDPGGKAARQDRTDVLPYVRGGRCV